MCLGVDIRFTPVPMKILSLHYINTIEKALWFIQRKLQKPEPLYLRDPDELRRIGKKIKVRIVTDFFKLNN